MRGRNCEYSNGGYVVATAIAGGIMMGVGAFSYDFSMRLIGSVFIVPAIIECSIGIGNYFFSPQVDEDVEGDGDGLEKKVIDEMENEPARNRTWVISV